MSDSPHVWHVAQACTCVEPMTRMKKCMHKSLYSTLVMFLSSVCVSAAPSPPVFPVCPLSQWVILHLINCLPRTSLNLPPKFACLRCRLIACCFLLDDTSGFSAPLLAVRSQLLLKTSRCALAWPVNKEHALIKHGEVHRSVDKMYKS